MAHSRSEHFDGGSSTHDQREKRQQKRSPPWSSRNRKHPQRLRSKNTQRQQSRGSSKFNKRPRSNNNNNNNNNNNDDERGSASFSSSGFEVVSIPINPNATMASDITSIQHIPAFSRIDIHFKAGAHCSRPYLMGRLVGPSLAMLEEWRWSPISSRNISTMSATVISGTYTLPVSGQYEVDIQALYCRDFLHNMHSGRLIQEKSPWDFNDFDGACMEDPVHRQLTGQNAVIQVNHHAVPSFLQNSKGSQSVGYWKHPKVQDKTDGSSPSPPSFLDVDCQGANPQVLCERDSSTPTPIQLEDYVFDYQSALLLEKKLSPAVVQETHVCLVGPAQSRTHLYKGMEDLLDNSMPATNLTLSWFKLENPRDVTKEFALNLVDQQQCEKIVLAGVAPWQEEEEEDARSDSSSWMDSSTGPTSVREYYHIMDTMLHNFLSIRDTFLSTNDARFMELYVISLHYIPLDERFSTCPPMDWRSPPVIDGYNVAISKVCNELGGHANNITFLDTGFLVDPLWDTAPKQEEEDLENFEEDPPTISLAASNAEALYVAGVVLGIIKPVSKPPIGGFSSVIFT